METDEHALKHGAENGNIAREGPEAAKIPKYCHCFAPFVFVARHENLGDRDDVWNLGLRSKRVNKSFAK